MDKNAESEARVPLDLKKTEGYMNGALSFLESIPWPPLLTVEEASYRQHSQVAKHNLERALAFLTEEETRRVDAFDHGMAIRTPSLRKGEPS